MRNVNGNELTKFNVFGPKTLQFVEHVYRPVCKRNGYIYYIHNDNMIACILTTYLPSIFYEKHDYAYSFVYEEYIWLGEKFAIPYETKSLKNCAA